MFLVTLINLLSTVAPTTSFWDCGEFIAASYTLGVPHPPGAPLYLLLGRLFSLLPFGSDVGFRVNLISVLVSALTIMLLYLSTVRLIRIFRGKEISLEDKILVYGSSAIGAFAFAFSHSFWFNAVEAEVYAPSLLFTAVIFYLALRWRDVADEPAGNRILIFMFYIIGLSSGVHLLNILAVIAASYVIAFKKFEVTPRIFIATGVIGSGVLFGIYPGLIQGLPTLVQATSVWSVVIIIVFLIWFSYAMLKKDKQVWALSSLGVLFVIVGYSTFLMIKIRSGLDPFLDENNPETWSKLLAYLNREQYGTESLFLTVFDRKAPFWSYQINHMFIRYMGWQYFELTRFFGLPFLLGVIGLVHHYLHERKGWWTVMVLFIMTGFAIVLYLNQDDPQPRERDYAYVGAYFAFAIWIGMGALAVIESALSFIKNMNRTYATAGLALLLFLAVPFNMWAKNYKSHKRSGNYVAWDYSYNLLQTCAPNAILYTNGDNDTFPLWYLQTVDEVRTDVRVVNLSLLNTGWFIQQIRDKEPKVPFPSSITDSYLDNVVDSRDISGLLDRRWQPKQRVKVDGPELGSSPLIWDVPATLQYPTGAGGRMESFLRVQDKMILQTIVANRWSRPIYFAVTVSDQNLLGLRNLNDPNKNYLTMEGLAFRLYPEAVPHIDAEMMAKNLLNTYQYRNLNNPDIYYNDNIIKLLGNYRQGLLSLAFEYLSATTTGNGTETGNIDDHDIPLEERVDKFAALSNRVKGVTALDFMEHVLPEDLIPINHNLIELQIGRIYAQLGKPEELVKRLDRITDNSVLNAQTAFEYANYYLSEAGNEARAKALLDISLEQNATIENVQRIAYTWSQLTQDTTYSSEVLLRYLDIDNSRQAKLRVGTLAGTIGLTNVMFAVYEPLLAQNSEDAEAVRGMLDYYQKVEDNERGNQLAEQWLTSNPTDIRVQRLKQQFELQLNQTQN